jgi:modulator of FtsH protease HflK
MNWSSKGNFPGGGDNGPWGRPRPGGGGGGNNGGGRTPPPGGPDFDAFFRKNQDRFKGVFDGGDGKRPLVLAGVALLAFWLLSGVYRVGADEQGVVLRFGKYHTSTGSGLHYHLPYPIETVYTPSVAREHTTSVRARLNGGVDDSGNRMLTGDLNLVELKFDVQWKIDSANTADYLFNIRNPDETIVPVAESVMREVIGQLPLEYIIDRGQGEIADRTAKTMQAVLDQYQAGIRIQSINLRKPDVPSEVIEAYQDVKKAEQDRETEVSKANRYRNQVIPTAKGEAVKMEQEALAYKERVIADAKGQASRFVSIYKEYEQAKDVTRKRMYLDTMEEMLKGMPKVIIDQKAGNDVLPYLPLPEIQKRKAEGQS